MEWRLKRQSSFPIKPTGANANKDNPYFQVGLTQYNLVYEKFGVPIDRAMELDCLTFAKLVRDAYVLRLKETEEGQNYLKDCWRLEQEAPDYEAIKKFNNIIGGA